MERHAVILGLSRQARLLGLPMPYTMAVAHRLTAEQVASTFTVYPSLTGTLAEAARRLHPTDGDA